MLRRRCGVWTWPRSIWTRIPHQGDADNIFTRLEKFNVIVFRDSNNCIVIVVKHGQEPTSFKMIFDDWE